MDFYTISGGEEELFNPYAGKMIDSGEWIEGTTNVEFLNSNFGHLTTAQDMIDATNSEGLKLFFAWLRDEGKLS